MDYLIVALMIINSLVSMAFYIYIMAAAFRERVLYGLMCLFCCGLGGLIYSIMRWEELKKPILGIVLCNIIGFFLQYSSGNSMNKWAQGMIEQTEQPQTSVFVPPGGTPAIDPATGRSYPARQINRANEVADRMAKLNRETGAMIPPGNASVEAERPAPASGGFEDAPSTGSAGVRQNRPASAGDSPTVVVKGDLSGDWQAASEQLKVTGVMKTASSAVAIVNRMAVELKGDVAVELNGQVFHFKLVNIDLNKKLVEFVPVRQ